MQQSYLMVLKCVLDIVDSGILVVNSSGAVLFCNRKFFTMWHIPPEMIKIGVSPAPRHLMQDQLVDPLPFLRNIADLYASPRKMLDILYFLDGRVFKWTFVPMYHEGISIGHTWFFDDITEKRKAEEKKYQQLTQMTTKRERQILVLVGRGYSSKEIAAMLGISQKTVSNHRANILGKLGASNFVEIAHWIEVANRMGVLVE